MSAHGIQFCHTLPRRSGPCLNARGSKSVGRRCVSQGARAIRSASLSDAATLVDEPPDGTDWGHDRTQIVIQHGASQVFTRRGNDWTIRCAHIAIEARQLPCQAAIIDGEIILADPAGASDFAGLQAIITNNSERLAFVAFDLLHLDGMDFCHRTLVDRGERLHQVIGQGTRRLQFSQALPGTGRQVFEVVQRAGLEGIVSKRSDSRYRSGRTRHWLKIKAIEEAEFELLASSANGASRRSP